MTDDTDRRPPWKRPRPDTPATTLTAEERHRARERARAAGRPYPNLVDNMAVIRTRHGKGDGPAATAKRAKKR